MALASIKIEQMARDANQEFQKKIIDTSINAAILTLENKLDEAEKINLINHSVSEFSNVLKNYFSIFNFSLSSIKPSNIYILFFS